MNYITTMCGRRHASPSIIDTDKHDNREFGLIKTVHALMIHSHAPTATQKKPTCQVVHDERPHDAYVWCLPFQSAAPLPCHTLTTHATRDATRATPIIRRKKVYYSAFVIATGRQACRKSKNTHTQTGAVERECDNDTLTTGRQSIIVGVLEVACCVARDKLLSTGTPAPR